MNYKGISSFICLAKRGFITALLTFASSQAIADGWAIVSQQTQLKDNAIIDVGEVSKVDPPFNTKWESDVYQMNGRCFTLSGYMGYWGYGGKAALLLVNAQKFVQLALLETAIGSIKVELHSISMIKCPTGTNVMPYSDNPEEQLRLLKKRLEDIKKQK
jgi:hypothetical protein